MQTDQLVFSASMLQDYVDCQRRFELKYIRKQSWPSIPVEPILELEDLIVRGRQFHLLAHQFFAGVPLEAIYKAINDTILREWFNRFVGFYDRKAWKQNLSEMKITSHLNQHRLIAVYDLVVQTNEGRIAIFDWKTSLHPPNQELLRLKIQSSIYPFILFENLQSLFPSTAKSGDPALSMTYWYPAFPDTLISFEYNQENHHENCESLQKLLDEIQDKIQNMQFHKTDKLKLCKYCQYRSLCDRGIIAGARDDMAADSGSDEIMIDFDELPEIDAEI